MTRLVVTAAGAVALILFAAFVASRLVRARTAGLSIRLQVFIALAVIVNAFAFGLGVLVLDRIEARATLLAESAARGEAAAVAALVAGEMEAAPVRLEDVARKLEAARGGSVELHLALLDPEGRTVFASGPDGHGPGLVTQTVPIHARGAIVGSVRVVKPTIVIRRVLEELAPTVLVITTILGVAAAGAAALIGKAIATPIEALTDFAVRVSEGERRAPPPPAHGREVQRLTRAIDSMRRELEGRPFVETFAADLSHELKNPVAAIRASAEVLADGALEEPEEATRFVSRILEATSRIEALLGELLSLARIEARGVEQATVVDLANVARLVAARAAERGRMVGVSASGGASGVRGDAEWLSRAVENLVDNADMHGEPGGPIGLEVARSGQTVVLTVRSRGAVARHVEKRIFRRFVTTRPDRGGTGLGLSIVRAVAEAHSGAAECTAVGPPDVTFRMTLPAA